MTGRLLFLFFVASTLCLSCWGGPWEDARSVNAGLGPESEALVVTERRWQQGTDDRVRNAEERVFVIDLDTGEEIQRVPWQPGNQTISAGKDGELLIWNRSEWEGFFWGPGQSPVRVPNSDRQEVRSLSPGGRWIVRFERAESADEEYVFDVVDTTSMEPTGARLALPWFPPLTNPGSIHHDWTPQGDLYVDYSRTGQAWLLDPETSVVQEVEPLPKLCARSQVSDADLASFRPTVSDSHSLVFFEDGRGMVLVEMLEGQEPTYEVLPATPASDEEMRDRVPPHFEDNFGMRYPSMDPACWDALRPLDP